MHKFFADRDAISGNRIVLSGDDARHISFSLRMKVGEHITVALPDGNDCFCTLESFAGGNVTAVIDSVSRSESEPPARIRLFQALPKGDKLEVIIQKAVECGAAEIIPFESSFCVAKVKDPEKKLIRWNRIAYEAAKQCGRSIIPKVLPPVSFRDAVKSASEDGLAIFCYENERAKKLGEVLTCSDPDTISVVVGSEGGFSPEEARFAGECGLTVTGLGTRILRCETAPVFVLSCISFARELC